MIINDKIVIDELERLFKEYMDLSENRPQSTWNKSVVGWTALPPISDGEFVFYFSHQLEYLVIEFENNKLSFTCGTNGPKCSLQGAFFGQEDKLEIIRKRLESFVISNQITEHTMFYCFNCGEELKEIGLGFLECHNCASKFLPYASSTSKSTDKENQIMECVCNGKDTVVSQESLLR